MRLVDHHPLYQPKSLGLPRESVPGTQSAGSSIPVQDKLTFGQRFKAGDAVPYRQQGTVHTVTLDNPVSRNNCQICSVKHLLHYYQVSPDTIDRIMEQGLKPYLLEDVAVPNNSGLTMKRGLFESEPGQYDIRPEVLREFLTQKLGFRFEELVLGQHNNPNNIEEERKFWEQCASIRASTKPLLIGLGHGAPNPMGGFALGHAIFASPVNGKDIWHFVDSEQATIGAKTGDELDDYIVENAKTHPILIHKVLEGPKADKLAQFQVSSNPQGHQLQGAGKSKPSSPVTASSEAGQSDSKSQKDSPTQPENKRKWYQGWGTWLKAQWQGLVAWIKSWFPGKKTETVLNGLRAIRRCGSTEPPSGN